MWDDVVIGTGDKGCSSVKVKGNISENVVSYWISGLYLDMGMTIFKGTEEGQYLRDMIDNGIVLEQIYEYLNGVMLSNIDKGKLKQSIDRAIKRAYKSGRADKAADIRSALGIH